MTASVSLVNSHFDTLLSRLDLTPEQRQQAATREAALREFLNAEFKVDGKIELIGSYARGTQIRFDRDLDFLLPIAAGEYWTRGYEAHSSRLVNELVDASRRHYPRTKIRDDRSAATLDMDGFAVDVVPAIRAGGRFLMPNGEDGWRRTNPLGHIALIARHSKSDNVLVPLIRLMKAWAHSSGFANALAIELLTEREWRTTRIPGYAAGCARMLKALTDGLRQTLQDESEPGVIVYQPSWWIGLVTPFAPIDRAARNAASALKAMEQGNEARALREWRSVFGDDWPSD